MPAEDLPATAWPRHLHLLASADRRGAEVFAESLVRWLRAAGSTEDLVALSPAAPGRPAVAVDAVAPSRPDRLVRELRTRAHAATVVVGHGSRGLPGGTASTLGSRTPFVYRSIGDPRHWTASSRARRVRVGLQLRRAAAVVALWPGAADAIVELFGVERRRVHVIPNAVPTDAFGPAEPATRDAARASYGLDERPVVAVVGAMGPEKRIPLAVAAAASVPDLQLIVAGDGPDRDAVEAAAAAMGPRARLVGVVANVASVYAAADVVLLTSATEGQPGTLVEAALCGVPAVATDVGGVASVVRGAELVQADATPATIAAALLRVLDDHVARGHEARAHAQAHLTFDAVGRAWSELLATVATAR